MKSTIQGFWLLSISMGDLLVVFLAPLEKRGSTQFLWIFAGLMAGAAAIFSIAAYFYKGKTYLRTPAPPTGFQLRAPRALCGGVAA